MPSLWVGIRPTNSETRILALSGPTETLLKARLDPSPRHPRALATLLEGLALWQGTQVRAALAVGTEPTSSGTSRFLDSLLDDSGPPLFSLEYVPILRRPKTRDGLGGLGDFRDLRQLLLFEAAR